MAKRQLTASAQVAKLIKAELKKNGISCTAKSDNFSMGSSVRVEVLNQPPWTMAAIEAATSKYQYGRFNGMEDIYEHTNSRDDIPQTKYLFIKNHFDDVVRNDAWIELCGKMADLEGKEQEDPNSVYLDGYYRDGNDMLWKYLTGLDSDFCYFKKGYRKLVNPVKSGVEELTGCYKIEEHTHTKKQTQMFICVNENKVSKDQFNSERDRAKSLNGWYSRKWENTPCGFAFNSMDEALIFCIPTNTPPPTKKDNIVDLFPVKNNSADLIKSAKFDTLADKMQNKIDDCLRDRPTHTARMMKQAQSAQVEGARLERTQKLLRALALGLESGTLSDELIKINSKSSAQAIMATKLEPINNGYHTYYADTGEPLYPEDIQVMQAFALISGTTEEEEAAKAERELNHKIANVKNSGIAGYFPTTGEALDQLIELSDIKENHRCLEPSAGRGDIADRIKSIGAMVDCIETNHNLTEILNLKGHNVCHDDFLECKPDFTRYDRIVMNPPFEFDAAATHIEHALKFLDKGGVLTAIIPCGMFRKTSKKVMSLNNILDNHLHSIVEMDEKSFASEGTQIKTQIIEIWSQ